MLRVPRHEPQPSLALPPPMPWREPQTTLYAVGHSTQPIREFIALLSSCGIRKPVDVRTLSKARNGPQVSKEALASSLRGADLNYRRVKELGGLFHSPKDNANTAERNPSFRCYAYIHG